MSISTTALSSNGQINIPIEILNELHWEAGHQLSIETTEAGVLLKSIPKKKKLRLEDLRGFLKYDGPPVSIEVLCKPVEYSNDGEEPDQRSQ